MSRTPQQIVRQSLKAAKEQGVIRDFALRAGGRATIYFADGTVKAGMKSYTNNSLETLAMLHREGFRPPEAPLSVREAAEAVSVAWDAWMTHEDGEGQDEMEKAIKGLREALRTDVTADAD